ncbi:MFS transporter [Paludibacter sp. 221]|uniref:MFS transporter n=1 Tax=Paludibacter sp. 221 TaxID=2302939 RepID=UPI0013D33206|nr:MFS transporter [Paludibacter sp. 221]NDV45646.1 MFS transporter [Paludibacter sp. 221]
MENWKKTFAIIWSGQFFSILSSSVVNFAIILWLSLETGSASVLATASIFALMPQAILGFFTGVFIDRWNRKRIMIAADSFIAVCSLLLAILFYTGKVETWNIYMLLAMRSIGSAFHSPAMQASIPLLAPQSELMRIAGINQTINSVSNIAGPAIGALLISFMDMSYVLMLDVLGALIACTSLLFVFIPNPEAKGEAQAPHVFREMKEGIQEITKTEGLPWLFLFSIICTFFMMPVSVMFPLMTLQHFDGNAFQMSIIEAAWGVGMLLGGALLGIKTFKTNNVTLINAMYILLGLTFLFSGILPVWGFALFAILTVIGGISGSIYYSAFTVVVQRKVEPSALGRVFSMFGSVSLLPSVIGLTATGLIADVIGVSNAFVLGGGIIIIIGIVAFLNPSLKKLSNSLKEQ